MPVSAGVTGVAEPGDQVVQGCRAERLTAVRRARLGALVLGLLCISHAENALADNAECGAAYVHAQQLMRGGELRAARGELIVCAKDCLPEVQRDCTTWLTEVGSSIPTLVVVALDAQGRELSDVIVEIDAERRATRLDGRSLEVDPGKRRLKLQRGAVVKQVTLTVLQGEKNRRVEVNFREVNVAPDTAAQLPADPAASSAEAPARATSADSLPALAWVSAGVGVVGVVGAAYFWLSAEQLRQDLIEQGCAPRCPSDDKDSVKGRRVAGDVLLGVGLLGASVFGYYWLRQPSAGPVASPLVGGGWAGWQQRF